MKKSIADRRADMQDEGRTAEKDFPVDISLMQVSETSAMRLLREQIEGLQAQYVAPREKEQKRLWNGFLAVVKGKSKDRGERIWA